MGKISVNHIIDHYWAGNEHNEVNEAQKAEEIH
jgi:hypothetical protein